MKKFVCSICGYVHKGNAPPQSCPVCKAPASKFSNQNATLLRFGLIGFAAILGVSVFSKVAGSRSKEKDKDQLYKGDTENVEVPTKTIKEDCMGKLIAYCGLDCAACDAYIATQNNDQALREKVAAEWSKSFNFDFTPEMINCVSCKGEGVHIGHCSVCEIRKCAMEKGLVNCGFCEEFKTCKTINDFIAQVPHVAENLG